MSTYNPGAPLSGFVRTERDMRQHYLVGFGQPMPPHDPQRGAYSRAEAWQDLIMEARYKDGYVMDRGRKLLLRPGQLLGATSFLANRWNWSPKAVRVFLDKLKADKMVRFAQDSDGRESGNHAATFYGNQSKVIEVCNYALYQVVEAPEWQHQSKSKRQPNGKQPATEGRDSKEEPGNKETHIPPHPPATAGGTQAPAGQLPLGDDPPATKPRRQRPSEAQWQRFWAAFPVKRGRDAALDNFRELTPEEAEQAIHGAKLYAIEIAEAQKARPGDVRIKYAQGWLTDRRWTDYESGVSGATGQRYWWQNPETLARVTDDHWRRGIAKHANGTWPPSELGPVPGTPGSVVPQHIVDEERLLERYDETGTERPTWRGGQ